MAAAKKAWKEFEDAFRAILDAHKESFDLDHVEPRPAKASSESGHVYDVEVLGYTKGGEKRVIFECRRKSRNLEPKDAGELAYRILATNSERGYFVTTLDKGLSEGAKTIAEYERIGHIQLSADATPYEYIMRYMKDFFLGVNPKIGASASVVARDPEGNIIGER